MARRASKQRRQAADRFAAGTAAEIHDGGEAMFVPSQDFIVMPPLGSFTSAESFYATALHELGHNAERRIMPHGRRRNLRLYRRGTCWLGIIWPNFREGWMC